MFWIDSWFHIVDPLGVVKFCCYFYTAGVFLYLFQDMVKADSSLRRSHDEVALLDTYASVRSNLVSMMIPLMIMISLLLLCCEILSNFPEILDQKWTIFFCCGELLTCSLISSLCHGILLEKWVYCIFTVRSLDLERRVERGRGPTQQWLIKVMVQIIIVRSVVILPLYNVKRGSLCSTTYFFPINLLGFPC